MNAISSKGQSQQNYTKHYWKVLSENLIIMIWKKIKNWLARADAFPKLDVSYLDQTKSGALLAIITWTIMTILMLSECYRYAFPVEKQNYIVDPTIGTYVPLTIDLWVATPCDQLVIVLSESGSETRFLNGNLDLEDEFMESEHFPPSFLQEMYANISGEPDSFVAVIGCRIKGSVQVMKGEGRLVIAPVTSAMGPLGELLANTLEATSNINFSHQIREFSFAAPQHRQQLRSDAPLKGTLRAAMGKEDRFTYFLSIIPTVLRTRKPPIFTNQYALKGFKAMAGYQDTPNPGLFFRYDHEALALIIDRPHLSLRQFLVHLVGILGGIFTCSGIIHGLVRLVVTGILWVVTGHNLNYLNRKNNRKNSDAGWNLIGNDGTILRTGRLSPIDEGAGIMAEGEDRNDSMLLA